MRPNQMLPLSSHSHLLNNNIYQMVSDYFHSDAGSDQRSTVQPQYYQRYVTGVPQYATVKVKYSLRGQPARVHTASNTSVGQAISDLVNLHPKGAVIVLKTITFDN